MPAVANRSLIPYGIPCSGPRQWAGGQLPLGAPRLRAGEFRRQRDHGVVARSDGGQTIQERLRQVHRRHLPRAHQLAELAQRAKDHLRPRANVVCKRSVRDRLRGQAGCAESSVGVGGPGAFVRAIGGEQGRRLVGVVERHLGEGPRDLHHRGADLPAHFVPLFGAELIAVPVAQHGQPQRRLAVRFRTLSHRQRRRRRRRRRDRRRPQRAARPPP